MGRPADWSRRAAQGARTVTVAAPGAPTDADMGVHYAPMPAYVNEVEEAEAEYQQREMERANRRRERKARMDDAREELELAELQARIARHERRGQSEDSGGGGQAQMVRALMESASEDRRTMMEFLTNALRQPTAPAVPPEILTGIQSLNARIDSLSRTNQSDPLETAVKMVSAVANLRGAIDKAVPTEAAGTASPADPVELLREQGNNIRLETAAELQRMESQRVIEEARQRAAVDLAKSNESIERTKYLAGMVTDAVGPLVGALGGEKVKEIAQNLGLGGGNNTNAAPGLAPGGGSGQTDTWACSECGTENVVSLPAPTHATCHNCGITVRLQ